MRKEDIVEASLKGPYVLPLGMLQSPGLYRQLRRILGLTVSRLPLGMGLEIGFRTQAGRRVPPRVRAAIEHTTGTRPRNTRQTLRGGFLREEVGDGSACRSWVLIMTKET